MPDPDVVIVGAGLAGLACALRLQEKNISCQILESADEAGGRIRTDVVEGFLLDRGFQVLLTAYPEAKQRLDYDGLHLKSFAPGAMIRVEGAFHKIADPFRRPAEAMQTVFSPIGSFRDKLKIASLRQKVCSGTLEELYARPELTTLEELRELGFSNLMIDRFFRPFYGGIFLEPDLATSSRKFEFVTRMFAIGEAALPARGMQAIPDQLADRLNAGTLRTGTRVTSIESNGVRLEDGDLVRAERVVLATSEVNATGLLGFDGPNSYCSATCLYYSAPEPPVAGPWLVLNGEGTGPINNLSVPSEVSPAYSASGRALVSVTVLGRHDDSIEPPVREQLKQWFGSPVKHWPHLRTYHIDYALPFQPPPALDPVEKPADFSERVFVCGDHADTASIQGALMSGRRAADAVRSSGLWTARAS